MKCTLSINGYRDDMPLEDAVDCARMLVALGRAIHPSQWVDAYILQSKAAALEEMF